MLIIVTLHCLVFKNKTSGQFHSIRYFDFSEKKKKTWFLDVEHLLERHVKRERQIQNCVSVYRKSKSVPWNFSFS